MPTPYRGQDKYNEFKVWDYEVDQWLEETGFKGRTAVQHIGSFLKEKAARWYMDFVAPDLDSYTVDTLKMALFTYCFLLDLKSKLWGEFKHTRQGSQKFQDYVRLLKRFQHRIPDITAMTITDRQLCIKLWETVPTYIRVKWTDAGMNSKDTALEQLCKAAIQFETAEEIQHRWGGRNTPGQAGNRHNTGQWPRRSKGQQRSQNDQPQPESRPQGNSRT
ncbi:hypothetical protein BDV93DRAFT_444052 [Ceratobasidium sp. AG-I]|nr:hypothetical protein BDV93DRAFT_444052 [Ceratobasidium sp. AG-I]